MGSYLILCLHTRFDALLCFNDKQNRLADKVDAARAGGCGETCSARGFFHLQRHFHYLGPAFAVLLFARVNVLGVAWLRIASAAVIFAFWKRPWRLFAELTAAERRIVVALGFVLAAMNVCFYLAINRLPLGTVGTIEFLGPIALAALGVRTMRNLAALLLACGGVFLLTCVRIGGEPIGYILPRRPPVPNGMIVQKASSSSFQRASVSCSATIGA